MNEVRTVSLEEAAARFGDECSPDWYAKQLRARKFPGHKIGRHWRLTEADIQAALDATYQAAIVPVKDPAGLTARSRAALNNGH